MGEGLAAGKLESLHILGNGPVRSSSTRKHSGSAEGWIGSFLVLEEHSLAVHQWLRKIRKDCAYDWRISDQYRNEEPKIDCSYSWG